MSRPSAPSTSAAALVDGVRVPYQRLGAGPAVLLLREGEGTQVAGALAARFRVFVPDAPGDPGVPASARARALLDGLGLARAAVVAEAPYAAEALWLAGTDPDRVTALVLLLDGAAEGGSRIHLLDSPSPAAPRVLLARGMGPEVGDFLAG